MSDNWTKHAFQKARKRFPNRKTEDFLSDMIDAVKDPKRSKQIGLRKNYVHFVVAIADHGVNYAAHVIYDRIKRKIITVIKESK